MSEYGELDRRALDILAGLGGCAAAPFYEGEPARHIVGLLEGIAGVEHWRDEYGNIVAHYAAGRAGQTPIAFVAHMDHPGYEIIARDDGGAAAGGQGQGWYVARALGGVPVASMRKRTPAVVFGDDGERIGAELLPLEGAASGASGGDRLARLRVKGDVAPDLPSGVMFDLPDFALDGDVIRMRAADDLAGCGAIIAALERLAAAGARADFYAVFTRAEEGGLFGARLMAEAGTLPKDTLVVSVESSPIIPGVEQGKGPVIRTGDRVYTFDADAEQALIAGQESVSARDGGFRWQRQLMSGGGCEATAFAVFGYKVTGLAFPLGNWHNATTSIGDPDGGVDMEYISAADYLGGARLMAEAAVCVEGRHNSAVRRRIREMPDDVRRRMLDTAGGIG